MTQGESDFFCPVIMFVDLNLHNSELMKAINN